MDNDFEKLVEDINFNLTTKIIGRNIIYFDVIDSTNDFLKENINDYSQGTIVVAKSQTLGRGRHGKKWENSQGNSVFMSLLLKPNIKESDTSCITLVIGLCILKALKYTNLPIKIKWPNDLIINGKKICGILSEAIKDEIGNVNMIIGIGLNVHNESFLNELASKATSLKIEGVEVSIPILIASICRKIEDYYNIYLKSGFTAFSKEYKNNCINIDKHVKIFVNKNEEKGEIIDINNDGSLVFIDEYGNRKNIFSGEVIVRGENGYV